MKYHKGFSNDRWVRTGERVHLSLTARIPRTSRRWIRWSRGARQGEAGPAGDTEGETILPVLIHGDAAFAGQGIVAETLNLSQLRRLLDRRHDPRRRQQPDRLHDHAGRGALDALLHRRREDDPGPDLPRERRRSRGVVHCVRLAMAYRQRFGDDVVIDLVCYRRHGHNEGDEPAFTQPLASTRRSASKPSVRKLYSNRALVELGVLRRRRRRADREDLSERAAPAGARVDQDAAARSRRALRAPAPGRASRAFGADRALPETACPWSGWRRSPRGSARLPAGLRRIPSWRSLLDKRGKVDGGRRRPIDWAHGRGAGLRQPAARAGHAGAALGAGQLARHLQPPSRGLRGRQETGEEYAPLATTSRRPRPASRSTTACSRRPPCSASSTATAWRTPTLTLWEAQFGDFVNGAQVIIDQFITSAHVKWSTHERSRDAAAPRLRGAGSRSTRAPGSSAFLQTCAEDCLQVVNCTTPAQYFHVLRRQMRRKYLCANGRSSRPRACCVHPGSRPPRSPTSCTGSASSP